MIVTILIGIAGALIGGFIGRAIGLYGPNGGAGYLMSIVGAVLPGVHLSAARSSRGPD